MISVQEAGDILCTIANSQLVSLKDAFGRVCNMDIRSSINIPAFPTSTRDGFGWNTEWNTRELLIFPQDNLAVLNPADNYNRLFHEGTSCYIATGGVVPKCFNRVIMFEQCVFKSNGAPVSFSELNCPDRIIVQPGDHDPSYIRPMGSDMAIGEIVCKRGTKISPGDIGLLASVGEGTIPVTASNKNSNLDIHVLSTGDELLSSGNPYTLGAVYDSNRPMLLSYMSDLPVTDDGILGDNEEEFMKYIQSKMVAKSLVIFISTGGASVGKKDFVQPALRRMGCKILIQKVNMMPGKPFLFAIHKDFIYFGLAGNPVASGVGYKLFIEPFLNIVLGKTRSMDYVTIPVQVAFSAKSGDTSRPEYHRVSITREASERSITDKWIAHSTGKQASSTLKSLQLAHALVCVNATEGIKEGDTVDAIVIDEEICDKIKQYKPKGFKIGVLTASDRASANIYEDKSGANIKEWCKANFVSEYEVVYKCVSDEQDSIETALKEMVEECGLVLTTGGTGPAKRDVTICAMRAIVDKELPGFGEVMRQVSLKYVPTAILSAQTAGIRYRRQSDGGALIINLPGSPKSISECLDAIVGAIPYGVELCGGGYVETRVPAFRGKK